MGGLVDQYPLLTEHASRVIISDDANHRTPTRADYPCDERIHTARHTKHPEVGCAHLHLFTTSQVLPSVSSVLRNAGKRLSSSAKRHKRASGQPEGRLIELFRTLFYNNHIYTHPVPTFYRVRSSADLF
jgi:hypothetical protein